MRSWRPFIPVWDGVRPPFFTWFWNIFRVTAEGADGGSMRAWVRCESWGVFIEWDDGGTETGA